MVDPRPPPARRKRLAIVGAGCAAVVLAVAGIGVWLATHEHAHAAPPEREAGVVVVAADAAKVPVDAAPRPVNRYVGSARCGDCHEKERARWQKTWHAKALAPGKPPFVTGDFSAHFAGTSSEAWMKRTGATYTMRTHGVDGALADFPIEWVIGGKRMQDDIAVMADGRWQVLPVYFHVTTREWVDYTEVKQGALTPEHPFFWTNVRRMANHECLDCHVTELRVDYDEAKAAWSTQFVDPNVACEDCHGPGGRHAESEDEKDIVHPVHAGDAGLAACFRCHGPRRPLWPLLDQQHAFEAGNGSYDELYDPIVVTMGVDRSPEFFSDGRPKTSSFEYQAMLQAACYRKGKATCLTCHAAPHEAVGRSELRDKDPDASCKTCHTAETTAREGHTHHKAAAAQRCVACHMAPLVSGVLDHFPDHTIDVPIPDNTVKHGVPNACGVCHADKPPEQLATALAGWWPHADARAGRRKRLADAFDEATASTSTKPLLEVIADDSEAPTLRGAAAIVLGRRFGPGTAKALVPLLHHRNLVLRVKACEALAAAKATAADNAIADLLGDPSLRVRLAAALALRDLHDPRAEAALRTLAEDPATTRLMPPHLELAQLAAARRDFTTARKELTAVVRLSPYFVDALVELAALSAEQGDFAEARKRTAQALALAPHDPKGVELKGKLDNVSGPTPPEK